MSCRQKFILEKILYFDESCTFQWKMCKLKQDKHLCMFFCLEQNPTKKWLEDKNDKYEVCISQAATPLQWCTGGEAPPSRMLTTEKTPVEPSHSTTYIHIYSYMLQLHWQTRSTPEHLSEDPSRVPLQCILLEDTAWSYCSTDIWIAL